MDWLGCHSMAKGAQSPIELVWLILYCSVLFPVYAMAKHSIVHKHFIDPWECSNGTLMFSLLRLTHVLFLNVLCMTIIFKGCFVLWRVFRLCSFHWMPPPPPPPPRWRLKSPASILFTQLSIQAQIKENIKAPRHWPLWGEFTGDRWIPHTKGQWRGKCFHSMTSSWIIMS